MVGTRVDGRGPTMPPTAAGVPPEDLPEVTLLDALMKIKELKAELVHVRQQQQTRIDTLTSQLQQIEAYHLKDRKKLMESVREREALVLSSSDPSRYIRIDAVEAMKRDHDAEMQAAQRDHREEIRQRDDRIASADAARGTLEVQLEFFKRRAALEEGEASLLRRALDSKQELDRRENALQGFHLMSLLLTEVREAYGSKAVDAVIMRTLKASAEVKSLTVDVVGVLSDCFEGFDAGRAAARLAQASDGVSSPDPAPAGEAGGIASPGPRSQHLSRLENGRLLVQRAMDLQRAAEDLRRSRSHESQRWDRSSHSPFRAAGQPGAPGGAPGGFLSPVASPRLPNPRTPPSRVTVDAQGGGGDARRNPRPRRGSCGSKVQRAPGFSGDDWGDGWPTWRGGAKG